MKKSKRGPRGPYLRLTTKQQLRRNCRKRQNGCWEFTGAVGVAGYGVLTRPFYGSRYAHRAAYLLSLTKKERKVLAAKSRRLFVCHRCDNRVCIKPKHLFLGTNQDNVKDCTNKQRHAHGETSYAVLTEKKVKSLRRRYAKGGISMRELGEQYNVSPWTIQAAISRRSWKHVP